MMLTTTLRNLFGLLVLASLGASLPAQTASPAISKDPLFVTISNLDTEFFTAMNQCDLKKVDSFWDEHIEFYHDKDGLTLGHQAMTDSIKNNVCGKFVRELVPGTLEVYPIHGYGAVEIGVHRFLHPYAQEHGVVGEAKFMQLWHLEDGRWRITRAISYGHGLEK